MTRAAGTPASAGRATGYVPGAIDDRSIERFTRKCLTMSEAEALAWIDREVAAAIEASRWEDAVKWQRVRLRVKRLRARIADGATD